MKKRELTKEQREKYEKAAKTLIQNKKDCEGFEFIEEGDSPAKRAALKEFLGKHSDEKQ